MGTSFYKGLTGPLQQWWEQSYDPSSGFTYHAGFRGFDFDAMSRLSNYYTQYGVSAVLRTEFGVTTLTLTDPTGNVLIDKWELGVDEEQPSIFENLLFNNLLANATDKSGAITALRNLLQNGDPLNSAWAPAIAAADPTANPPVVAGALVAPLGATFLADSDSMTKLKAYFDGYNLGVTNFMRGKYRLRHTMNAPARWSANVADFNVEKVYTIAQLLSECQNTNLWVLPLPGYLAYKILTYYSPNLSSLPNYMFGALKLRSNACTAANNRVDITTEYLIDQINMNLYQAI